MPTKMMQQSQMARMTTNAARPDGRRQARRGNHPQLRHDIGGTSLTGKQDAERHDHEIVEIAEHGNEIRDQVDRRQRVGGNAARHRLGTRARACRAASHSATTSRFSDFAQSLAFDISCMPVVPDSVWQVCPASICPPQSSMAASALFLSSVRHYKRSLTTISRRILCTTC